MKKIDLLIIGAGRSGTTTIYKYLEEHQQICFSKIKEIHYFSINELFEREDNYYHSFFKHYNNEKIIASADTYLLIDKDAPKKILNYNPNMKFIIMFREPVSRTFSGYNYAINNGYLDSKISFIESIKNEKELLKKDLSIEQKNNICNAEQSLYSKHLKYYEQFFPKKNFLLLETQELKDNLNSFLKKTSSFLKIKPFETKNTEIIANKGTSVKSKKLQQFLLNRNTKGRKLIRKIVPTWLKQSIINSKIADKLHSANKYKTKQNKITEKEKSWAKKYFEKEITILKKEYNISF